MRYLLICTLVLVAPFASARDCPKLMRGYIDGLETAFEQPQTNSDWTQEVKKLIDETETKGGSECEKYDALVKGVNEITKRYPE